MTTRISYQDVNKGFADGLMKSGMYIKKSTLDPLLLELLHYRVSQINGCAYCLDMGHKEAMAKGELQERLHGLAAWREFSWYTEQERVALAYAEALTNASSQDIEDALFAQLQQFFTLAEIADLALAVSLTNVWNRINKTFRPVAGSYQVGQYA
ncbi:carboxymuconolactone decarboxylase family protein [Chitinophaga horti]|uniref:Carboxymuconolactone decarboxylase family protein n=1 Tax=Chitinophaga horti TaxID=2920382 RepID=A0ABY6IVL8_9BACT|nr:carboxymuconolactone decarboxylase family protein [Chitinophaga horti]UYQ91246.1 carboxymuconolactone decarboxylase family protein [Chitinophaga horti]